MVSKRIRNYHPASAPRDFGSLIQASFHLWGVSVRPVFRDAVLASLFSSLPLLPWWWVTRAQFADNALYAWIDPAVRQPGAFELIAAALLSVVSLWFFLSLLRRQGLLARGQDDHPTASPRFAWQRLPAALLASLSYCALTLLAMAPIGMAMLLGLASDDPLMPLLALLIGLLLSAAPLAWVSIAACFIYPPILLDGLGGLAAQRLSFRLVSGHWTRCAGVLSIVTLIVIGLLGVVGALPFLITAAIAVASGGMEALLRPGWLVFGQILTAPLMALLLPLMTAGYLVCYEDLRLRMPAPINSR